MQNQAVASVLLGGLLFVLPGCSEAQTGANANSRIQSLNGFNVSNAVIPTSEIRSGGPPRDGIPAIDRPKFVAASTRPRHVAMVAVLGVAALASTALAAWNSGKIVHRQVAIRQLSRVVSKEAVSVELRTILRVAAFDPDMNVREAALTGLHAWEDPALTALAAAQIADHDPHVRMLGLQYLKQATADVGVPLIVPLLDEADPFFLAMSLKLLEKWSEQDFGVKLGDTAPAENEKTGLKEFREGSHAKAKAGAERAKEWWSKHRDEFQPVQLEIPLEARSAMTPVPAADFNLNSLDGRRVRLSDFRGKVVLINFWTTWCTACVSEIPALIELQKRHGERLAGV